MYTQFNGALLESRSAISYIQEANGMDIVSASWSRARHPESHEAAIVPRAANQRKFLSQLGCELMFHRDANTVTIWIEAVEMLASP